MAPPSATPASKPAKKPAASGAEVIPSLSASVLLFAPLAERTADGYDYRVLLLKRHAKSSTFVSAHVFPGGNLDPADKSPEWARFFPSPSTLLPDSLSAEAEKRMQSIKICAVRETFEECGILLHESLPGMIPGRAEEVWAGVSEDERRVWRDKVHSNGSAFIDLFKLLSSQSGATLERPGVSKLAYRANWITPKSVKRRFDTHFFAAVLPPTTLPTAAAPVTGALKSSDHAPLVSTPIASSDGKETISADWLTPSEAIRRTLPNPGDGSSSIILFPPQFYLLSELIPFKSLSELLDHGDRTKIFTRSISAFVPEVASAPDLSGKKRSATVLPGDPLHSETEKFLKAKGLEAKPYFKNRSYVGQPKVDKNGMRPPGLTVEGCHREGMEELFGPHWDDIREGDFGGAAAQAKL